MLLALGTVKGGPRMLGPFIGSGENVTNPFVWTKIWLYVPLKNVKSNGSEICTKPSSQGSNVLVGSTSTGVCTVPPVIGV